VGINSHKTLTDGRVLITTSRKEYADAKEDIKENVDMNSKLFFTKGETQDW
jgi:mitochondrial fission protein ELM1